MRRGHFFVVVFASLTWGCGSKSPKPAESTLVVANTMSNSALVTEIPQSLEKPASVTSSEPTETNDLEAGQDSLTAGQRNAVRSAESYLRMTGFSRDGLIQQLSSDAGDGYSELDATAAVDSLSVNWNENATRSAQSYLNMSGFSCSGLIEQLSSDSGDKYTVSQATYGANQAGAC